MPKQIFNPLTGSFDQVIDQASELNYSPSTPSEWPTLPAKVDDALDYLRADLVDNAELIKEPTGFPNRTDTTLSFVDGTREFTIAPTGASFDVYVKGKKFTKTSESIVLSNDDGNHYIFYNSSGVLTETTAFDPSIFADNALISIIYWNSSNNLHTYFAEERHGLVMDGATHGYLHTVFGARYLTGLALQSFVVDGDGTLDTQAQFQADAGTIRDEDIIVSLSADSTIPVLYRQGTLWRKKPADAYPVIYNGTAGYVGTNIAYNQLVGASWQLTEVINNNYVLMHIFATNDIENPFVAIVGINSYANIPEARTGAESEISSLSGLPFAEFVAVGTVIYQTNSAYTNVPKAIVRSASAGEDYVDFRGEQLYTPSGIATSHSLLSNLSSDDHLQYYNEARGDARYVRDGANVGTGTGVFAQKNTTNLEFKSLVQGTDISITSDADEVTIGFNGNASTVNYTPAVAGDWSPVPTKINTALDELAARITTANGEVVLDVQSFSGDALQTVFALSPAPASGDSFLVFIDGVYQLQSSYSYVSPNITFTSAPPTGTNNIEVRVASADLIVNGILPTTTKGDLVVHDGIQNVRLPVGGTEGQVLSVNSSTSTGLEWTTLINFLTNAPTKQTFTTDGTWTKPVGCKAIIVELQGGGGGGSNFNTIYNSSYYIGMSGYPGQYAKFLINNPDASYAITIGGGGAAAISGTNAASSVAGGTTSFGAYSVAGGGLQSNSSGYTNQTTVPHTGKFFLTDNTSFPNLPATGIIETYHIDHAYQGWYIMGADYFLQSDGPPTKFGRGGGGGQSTTAPYGSGFQAPSTSYGAGGGNATAGRPGVVVVHEFY